MGFFLFLVQSWVQVLQYESYHTLRQVLLLFVGSYYHFLIV